jgi:hypothetical protein
MVSKNALSGLAIEKNQLFVIQSGFSKISFFIFFNMISKSSIFFVSDFLYAK